MKGRRRAFSAATFSDVDVARFWEKVDIRFIPVGSCWEWTGGLNSDGYGRFKLNGQDVAASRISLALSRGFVTEHEEACHTCDNPKCVRPDHLFAGTRQVNIADMVTKGRHAAAARGAIMGKRKLTAARILEIAAAYGSASNAALAKRFEVSASTVARIGKGQSWQHVPRAAA